MFRPEDRLKCKQLYQKYYAGRKFKETFYEETVQRYLTPGCRVLDAGCGRYLNFSKKIAGRALTVGIDLDTVLETANQRHPYAVRGDLAAPPFASNIFDLIVSRSVIEHLPDPPQVFREFLRVLKPGGILILLTPNKYDYVSLLAAITPYRWHRTLVSKIFQIPADDVFPTHYRANTASALRRDLSAAGYVEKEMRMLGHYPAYLMFSPVLFRLGVLAERITSWEIFRSLRGSILCVFEKPAAPSDMNTLQGCAAQGEASQCPYAMA